MKRCSFREKVSPQDPKEQEQKAGGGKEILGDEISLGHGKEIKIFDIPLTAEIDRIIDQRNHVAHGGIISHTVDGHSQAAEENSLRQDTEEITPQRKSAAASLQKQNADKLCRRQKKQAV